MTDKERMAAVDSAISARAFELRADADRRQQRDSTRARPTDEQMPPIANDSAPIVDLVLADIDARVKLGLERYGTKLQANNGRDALSDAYQEALDLVFYLRQAIAERDGR